MTASPRGTLHSPEPTLERLAHLMASNQGMPDADPEFPSVVASFVGHWSAVEAIHEIAIDPSIGPAPKYDPLA